MANGGKAVEGKPVTGVGYVHVIPKSDKDSYLIYCRTLLPPRARVSLNIHKDTSFQVKQPGRLKKPKSSSAKFDPWDDGAPQMLQVLIKIGL